MGLDPKVGDSVLFFGIALDEAEVIFYTAGGMLIRFQASQVNEQAMPSA